jgi:hypothetical protein
MAICTSCADNIHLKKILVAEGADKYCSTCRKQQSHVFDIAALAELIDPIIQKYFCLYGDDQSDVENEYLPGRNQFDLAEIVTGILHQDVDFRDDLVEHLIGRQPTGPFGPVGFFDAGNMYSPIEVSDLDDTLTPQWNALVDELKHRRRFFSDSVRKFFDGIFGGVEHITSIQTSPLRFQNVIRQEEPGLVVHRSRVVSRGQIQQVQDDPFKHVGPAPKDKARAGRMNAEGVVVIYCSLEKDTAIAELRPAIGQISAVIELRFTRMLRLLDFKRFERAMDDGWAGLLDPQHETTIATRNFLRKLHGLISKPVVPGRESDYLITQTMAEYLAHVQQPEFDGILFGSSQWRRGTNLVIFADRPSCGVDSENTFPVIYIPGSLEFYGIEEVQYTHSKIERGIQRSLWDEV